MPRYEWLSVKVSKDIKAEYVKLSESYGLPMSTVTAFILGQWIRERKQEPFELPAGLAAEN